MDTDTQTSFLAHLRTIHFTLLLTAFALLLAPLTTPREERLADEELKTLVRVVNGLTEEEIVEIVQQASGRTTGDGEDLQTFVDGFFREYLEDALEVSVGEIELSVDTRAYADAGLEEWQREWLESEPNWLADHALMLVRGDARYARASEIAPATRDESLRSYLDEFVRLAGPSRVYHSPETIFAFHHAGSSMADVTAEADEALREWLRDGASLSIDAELESITWADDVSRRNYADALLGTNEDPIFFESFDGRFDVLLFELHLLQTLGEDRRRMTISFALPTMFEATDVDLVERTLVRLDRSEAVASRYLSGVAPSAMFPNLDRQASLLDSADVSDLGRHLEARVNRASAAISVFGLPIDVDQISSWGALILIGIQLYFTVHFANAARLLPRDELTPFPWIGCYPDLPSRIIFCLSLTAPSAVCIYTFVTFANLRSAFGVALTLGTVALCGWSILVWHRHWRGRGQARAA